MRALEQGVPEQPVRQQLFPQQYIWQVAWVLSFKGVKTQNIFFYIKTEYEDREKKMDFHI